MTAQVSNFQSETPEGYRVQLDVFEGPLDLLLYLIKRDEIDIYDIPIAHITEQYLELPAADGAARHRRGRRLSGHGRDADLH